jgi:hypothetical protein
MRSHAPRGPDAGMLFFRPHSTLSLKQTNPDTATFFVVKNVKSRQDTTLISCQEHMKKEAESYMRDEGFVAH